MKKIFALLAFAVLLLPMLGFSDGSFSFRVGYFVPRADSDLWKIEFDQMSFRKSNFQTATFGLSYECFMTRELSLVFSADIYDRSRFGYYRDYVGVTVDKVDYAFPAAQFKGDFDITHSFGMTIVPLQASIKLTPFGRRGSVIPYVGGGVSLFLWNVRLQGDTIDFTNQFIYTDPVLGDVDVFGLTSTDAREDTRLAVGWHAFGGVSIPFASRAALEAEFRYNNGKGKLIDAFAGFEKFDLSGFQISLGINYWF